MKSNGACDEQLEQKMEPITSDRLNGFPVAETLQEVFSLFDQTGAGKTHPTPPTRMHWVLVHDGWHYSVPLLPPSSDLIRLR